jgi:hypothetical protein
MVIGAPDCASAAGESKASAAVRTAARGRRSAMGKIMENPPDTIFFFACYGASARL